jgi:hypothetical protein
MRDRKRKIVALLENSGKVVMDDPRADFINKVHQSKVSVSRMHRHSTGWALCHERCKEQWSDEEMRQLKRYEKAGYAP